MSCSGQAKNVQLSACVSILVAQHFGVCAEWLVPAEWRIGLNKEGEDGKCHYYHSCY